MLSLVELIAIVGDNITPITEKHLEIWNGYIECFAGGTHDNPQVCLNDGVAFWVDGNPYCLEHLNQYVDEYTR